MLVQDSLEGAARTFIDPNTWSEDGTVALGGYSFSEDGEWFAYQKSESGSDWKTIQVCGSISIQLSDVHLNFACHESLAFTGTQTIQTIHLLNRLYLQWHIVCRICISTYPAYIMQISCSWLLCVC